MPLSELQRLLLERCSLPFPRRMPWEPRKCFQLTRARLFRAEAEGLLDKTISPERVRKLFRLVESEFPPDHDPEKHGARPSDFAQLLGGEKVMRQETNGQQFVRSDGAWFHWTLTVRHNAKTSHWEPFAYDYEIVFPGRHRGPRFVRYDMNVPGHANEVRHMRSHLHPGIDEEGAGMQLPAPVLHPLEVLELFLHFRWEGIVPAVVQSARDAVCALPPDWLCIER